MTTAQTNGAKQPSAADQARRRFLDIIKAAAVEFGDAAPLSVNRNDRDRAIDRVIAAFRAAAAKNPKFYTATPASLGRAISLCALTGLMPGGPIPDCDLIPRQRRKQVDGRWVDGDLEIDWQLGWRGYVTLAARAGCRARPVPVMRGEPFEWTEGLDRKLNHTPTADGESENFDELVLVYVVAQYRDGFRDFEVLRKDGIEARRDRSESWVKYLKALEGGQEYEIKRASETPWVQWPVEMARKTAMRFAGSRGLLAFDETGRYAFEQDGRKDVMDASEVDARAAVNRPALPDNSFLDEVEEQQTREPARGMAAVRAAVEQVSPPPSTKPDGMSSGVATRPEAGTPSRGSGPPAEPKAPAGPSKSEREQAQDDAVRTAALMTTTRAPGSRVSLEHVRAALRTAKSITKVSDMRFERALEAGTAAGLWTRDGADVVLPSADVPAEPTEDRWSALAGDALVEAIGSISIRVGDSGTQTAMVELGLTEEQVAGDATEDQLRALGRLLDRAEAELRAEVARHGEE